jgi:thioredoxin reductase
MNDPWDCIVVGAGAAGLSAALVLGRARRRTLVVDAGAQSNLSAEGVGGLLGHNRRPPADLYELGRAEVGSHPTVELCTGTVVGGARDGAEFVLELADGRHERARRVLLATGMAYRPPELTGLTERWGRSVFHCPFCHGWEVRDLPLGVLDRGSTAVMRGLLLRAWSDDVTVYTDGPDGLSEDELARLGAASVAVERRRVAALRGPGAALTEIVLADGTGRPCGGLLVPITLAQRSPLATALGAATGEPGPHGAEGLAVDAMYETSVPGLYAAGDLQTSAPSVANAIAEGSNAAAAIVRDLMWSAR